MYLGIDGMRIRLDREKNTINEINWIEQISLGNVSLEFSQDIKAMHGIDVMQSMLDSLAYEMTSEIDKEIIRRMHARIDITHFDRVIHLCLTAKNYHLKTS